MGFAKASLPDCVHIICNAEQGRLHIRASLQIGVVYLHSQGLNKSGKGVLQKSNNIRESYSLDREI